MKKKLGRAVSALMGLGLLFAVTSCAGGDNKVTPSTPKVDAVAAASLEKSGATVDVESEAQLVEVMAALAEEFGADKKMVPVANIVKSVVNASYGYDDDMDMGDYDDDFNWDDDWDDSYDNGEAMESTNILSVLGFDDFADEFEKFLKKTTEFPEDKLETSAEMSYDKTADLNELFAEAEDMVEGNGKVSLKADLSSSGKITYSTSSMTVKQTQSLSGSVSAAAEMNVKPLIESGLKDVKAAAAGALTLAGVSVTQKTVVTEDDYKTSASGSGKIYLTAAASTGASVCTEEGLGGKILISADGLVSTSVSDLVKIANDAMSSIENNPYAEYSGLDFEDFMEALKLTVKVTVKAYNDDGKETFSKTYNSIEELAALFPVEM